MLDKEVKQSMQNAAKFARKCGTGEIQSEHLFYGILMVDDSKTVKM